MPGRLLIDLLARWCWLYGSGGDVEFNLAQRWAASVGADFEVAIHEGVAFLTFQPPLTVSVNL